MVGEIGAALVALKSAFDLTKTVADIGDQVALNNVAIKLQEQIIAAQLATMSTQERLRELESKVDAYESWEVQKARYKLVDYGASTFAWELRADEFDKEPLHRVCPKCFEQKKRAILQFRHRTAGHQDLFVCSSCATEFFFGAYESRSHSIPIRRNRTII